MQDSKIIIISESESVISTVTEILESKKIKHAIKKIDIAVVKYIEEQKCHLILFDLSHETTDRFKLLKKIKNTESIKEIPLMFFVNYSDHKTKIKGLELGADDFISLPYHIEVLKNRICNHLKSIDVAEELSKSRIFFKKILDFLPIGVFVQDKKSEDILFANPALKELFQIDENNVKMKFPKGLRKKLKNVFNSLEKKEKRSVKGFKYLLEEISKSLYSINTIIDDIDGEFEYKLSIFEDRSKIEQAKSRLKKMANFDSLTGIGNRRHIKHFLNLEKHRYDRYKVTFAILIADIDDFKSFNDTYGHYCGDYVLREISEIFNDTIRKVDKVARWGGEEFLFLLPQTDNKGIDKISEKIRKKVEKHTFIYNEHKLHITISIGGSRITNTSQNYEDVIEEADKALYLAKRNGKNQCELFDVTK